MLLRAVHDVPMALASRPRTRMTRMIAVCQDSDRDSGLGPGCLQVALAPWVRLGMSHCLIGESDSRCQCE
jgi:hypothetical protein